MTGTPMRAAMPNEQGVGLSESMQAVYDSIKNDEETRLKNVQLQNQLPQQLAQFSQTASNLGNTLFQKRIEDISAKALYDARMDGSINQEQIAAYDAEINNINSNHRTIEKAADSIEQADQHDIVAERVRSTDPYYQYYYKLGQLRNQVSELPMLHAQLKDTLTIPGADGKPLTYDAITEYDDMAAWNAKAEVYMNRAFAGVSPELAAKEIFPGMDDLFKRDAQKWATANAKKRKEARTATQQELIFDSITSKDPEKIKTAFETSTLSIDELWAPINELAKRGDLNDVQERALGDTLIKDRATGKLVPIRVKFSRQFEALEGLAEQGTINRMRQDDFFEERAFLDQVKEDIAVLDDPDRFTIPQIEQFIDKYKGYNNPNAQAAIRRLEALKPDALDYFDPQEEERLYRMYVRDIDNGMRIEDIEKRTSGTLRQRLRAYMQNEGKSTSGGILSRHEVAFESVEAEVKSAAGVTPLSAASGSVALEIEHQQKELSRLLKEMDENPNLSDAQKRQEALKKWKANWDKSLATEGYKSEDGFPGAWNRMPVDAANMQAGIDRAKKVVDVLKGNSIEGVFENYEQLYTPEQFKNAVKGFRNGNLDSITSLIARDTNMTPLEVLEKLSPMFNVDLPPIAPEVRTITQQLTKAQKAQLTRHPSERRLERFRGVRTLVGEVNLTNLRDAIIGNESGGNPSARNKRTSASGLGQILPSNIPQWSQDVLGREVSYEEFMANPNLQIQIIDGKLKQMLEEQRAAGYSGPDLIRRVASQWYSGQPGLLDNRRGQGPQGNEPSIYTYTSDILQRYQSNFSLASGERSSTGALTYNDNKDSYNNAGKAFQDAGFKVAEHSSFGGTAPVHSSNSYHKYDEAFDITHQTGDYNASIEKTARLQDLIERLDLFQEVIGPRSGRDDHKTHLHLGGLKRPLTAEDIRLINSIK
tara:strand:+ start:454 stop:3252 length:2799 start_codon:yes stop_codon:yes gene_type:complete